MVVVLDWVDVLHTDYYTSREMSNDYEVLEAHFYVAINFIHLVPYLADLLKSNDFIFSASLISNATIIDHYQILLKKLEWKYVYRMLVMWFPKWVIWVKDWDFSYNESSVLEQLWSVKFRVSSSPISTLTLLCIWLQKRVGGDFLEEIVLRLL